jgi:hypothetical protein
MPNPDSVYFSMGYAVCLGLISLAALECVRRFRHPLASFVIGLAALGATLWFALSLESGLLSAGEWSAQMGPPYHYFRRVAFAVFLVFYLLRSGYLIRHAFSRRSSNAA